ADALPASPGGNGAPAIEAPQEHHREAPEPMAPVEAPATTAARPQRAEEPAPSPASAPAADVPKRPSETYTVWSSTPGEGRHFEPKD
ncbi:MAG: hypothetical protein WAW79_11790, partial [Steroidobacteraceae bacterium]